MPRLPKSYDEHVSNLTKSLAKRKGSAWRANQETRHLLRFGSSFPTRRQIDQLGNWYDYPKCCVVSFTENIDGIYLYGKQNPFRWKNDPVRSLAVELMQKRNEFHQIPCLACAKRYLQKHLDPASDKERRILAMTFEDFKPRTRSQHLLASTLPQECLNITGH